MRYEAFRSPAVAGSKASRMPARNPFSGVSALSSGTTMSSPNVAIAFTTGSTLRQPVSLRV